MAEAPKTDRERLEAMITQDVSAMTADQMRAALERMVQGKGSAKKGTVQVLSAPFASGNVMPAEQPNAAVKPNADVASAASAGLKMFERMIPQSSELRKAIDTMAMLEMLLIDVQRPDLGDPQETMTALGLEPKKLKKLLVVIFSKVRDQLVPENTIMEYLSDLGHTTAETIFYDLLQLPANADKATIQAKLRILLAVMKRIKVNDQERDSVLEIAENILSNRDVAKSAADIVKEGPPAMANLYDESEVGRMLDEILTGPTAPLGGPAAAPERLDITVCIDFVDNHPGLPAIQLLSALRRALQADSDTYKRLYYSRLNDESIDNVISNLDAASPRLVGGLGTMLAGHHSVAEILEATALAYSITSEAQLIQQLDRIYRVLQPKYPNLLATQIAPAAPTPPTPPSAPAAIPATGTPGQSAAIAARVAPGILQEWMQRARAKVTETLLDLRRVEITIEEFYKTLPAEWQLTFRHLNMLLPSLMSKNPGIFAQVFEGKIFSKDNLATVLGQVEAALTPEVFDEWKRVWDEYFVTNNQGDVVIEHGEPKVKYNQELALLEAIANIYQLDRKRKGLREKLGVILEPLVKRYPDLQR